MKLTKIYFILLFIHLLGYSQFKSIEVDYVFKIQTENSEEFIYNNKLIANERTSLYGIIDSASTNFKLSKKYNIYYDTNKDEMFLESPIFNKDFYILENNFSQKMKWELLPDVEKEILGYKCKSAKILFRGRSYLAYYSEEILFSFGPLKFNGLPGLILEIHTDDYKFHFVANHLNLKEEEVALVNPYKSISQSEYMSFKEYKILLLKKLQQFQQKIQSEEKDDTEYNVNDQSIELND